MLEPDKVAEYILDWLEHRNGGEFQPAIGAQRYDDRKLMLDELAAILRHGGKPPNWIS